MNKELNELISSVDGLNKVEFREKMTQFVENLASHQDAVIRESYKKNDSIDTMNNNELEHFFGEGTYIRKITMRKNSVIVSAIHLIEHPFFVMEGKATVVSPEGLTTITAPYFGMTKPGTQRLLYIHEDCVWITVHPTDKTDVEEIVNDVTSQDYNHEKLKIN